MNIPRVLRFLISGGSAALIEYGSFLLLLYTLSSAHIVILQAVSFMMGFMVSFLLNRTWVFKSTGNSKNQLVKYSLLAGVNLGLSSLVMWFFVDVASVNAMIAKIAVMAMIAVWNYLLFSRLIFVDK